MVYLAIVFALLIGLAIGYLLAERRARAAAGDSRAALSAAEQRGTGLALQLDQQASEILQLRRACSDSDRNTAVLATQLDSARQNLLEQRKLLDDANAQLSQSFATVSAEALAKNNEAFLQLAKERFATISTEGILRNRGSNPTACCGSSWGFWRRRSGR
jgi:DNA recombination protein RmuC